MIDHIDHNDPLFKQQLLKKIWHDFKFSQEQSARWRSEAREDYAFAAGDQYPALDRMIMAEQQRPAITFNRIGPILDAVLGLELSNQQGIQVLPREANDAELCRFLSQAIEWIREQNDAHDEESDAFYDMVVCGMGWVETRLGYKNHQPTIHIERVDPLEMYWDPCSNKTNLDDARYVIRSRHVQPYDLKRWWPDAIFGYEDKKQSNNLCHVLEYQWKEYNQNGQAVCYQAMVNEHEVFHVKQLFCNQMFSYLPMTGKRDRNNNSWYGLVRPMKDPQRWANKWLSQVLHIINTNAKGGLLAERGAFLNPKRAEMDWADPSSIVLLNDGGLNKVQPKPVAPYPVGLDRLMELAIHSIRDVTGVNLELLGLAERLQPGVLEQQRKQAGMTLLARYFHALKRYRKQMGEILIYCIAQYLCDGRLIRISGENGHQFLPLKPFDLEEKYDIKIDEVPTTPNNKEQNLAVLQQVIPLFMEAGLPVPVDIVDHLPLPQSLRDAWKSQKVQK